MLAIVVIILLFHYSIRDANLETARPSIFSPAEREFSERMSAHVQKQLYEKNIAWTFLLLSVFLAPAFAHTPQQSATPTLR